MKNLRKIFGLCLLVLVLSVLLVPGKARAAEASLVKKNGTWYYTLDGKMASATTLVKYNGGWYYVSNGKVDFSATTLVKYNGGWYYVEKGKVDFKATTLCKYNNKWYYVENGKLNTRTTLCKYNGKWYYVSGGKLQSSATTLCKYNGKWYYVKDGKLNTSTALVKYGAKQYYVSGGKLQSGISGKVTVNGGAYFVKNGVLTTCHRDGHSWTGNLCRNCGIAPHYVTVQSKGGLRLERIRVVAYDNGRRVDSADTDDYGQAVLALVPGKTYQIRLENVPQGYKYNSAYSVKSTKASITLTSAPISGKSLAGASLELGDVMIDFTVTTSDGQVFTLSEVLKQKNAVVLNFWYQWCGYCVEEFPYIQQAYQKYGSDVAFIGLDPMDNDAAINRFKVNNGLTLPMAKCSDDIVNAFGVYGYPTSIVIDRYGVITAVQVGYTEAWERLFAHYAADRYSQTLFDGFYFIP